MSRGAARVPDGRCSAMVEESPLLGILSYTVLQGREGNDSVRLELAGTGERVECGRIGQDGTGQG